MQHDDFIKEAEQTQARADLADIVKSFNENFRDWEDIHEYRANFRFNYDEKSGRKILAIADIEPVNMQPITPESLKVAEETVGEALSHVDEQPVEEQVHKFPELGKVSNELQNELKAKARNAVNGLVMGLLGQNDMLLLSALGIDAKEKILDVLIEECKSLKEEPKNGTSRTWRGT